MDEITDSLSCKVKGANGEVSFREPRSLIESLPDISVRFAVGSFKADGGLSFGPVKVTTKGHVYRAVLDYVNVEVVPVPFLLRKAIVEPDGVQLSGPLSMPTDSGSRTIGHEAIALRELDSLTLMCVGEVR